MDRLKVRQQKKNEALNKIMKIYHPLYNFPYDQWSEESGSEQRESEIRSIISELNKELETLKLKKLDGF